MDINSKDTAFLEITAHKRHNLSTNFVQLLVICRRRYVKLLSTGKCCKIRESLS